MILGIFLQVVFMMYERGIASQLIVFIFIQPFSKILYLIYTRYVNTVTTATIDQRASRFFCRWRKIEEKTMLTREFQAGKFHSNLVCEILNISEITTVYQSSIPNKKNNFFRKFRLYIFHTLQIDPEEVFLPNITIYKYTLTSISFLSLLHF